MTCILYISYILYTSYIQYDQVIEDRRVLWDLVDSGDENGTCMYITCIIYIHIHILRIIYTGIEDGCVVWDLVDGGGENGTFLNGQRVIRARVRWYVPPMYASM